MSVYASLMNNRFQIARKIRASDGKGGWLISYQEIPSVLGRLRPATAKEREVAQREERYISHVFYTLPDAAIKRGDLVSIGALSIDGNQVLTNQTIVEIDGLRNPSESFHHFEFDAHQIQDESRASLTAWIIANGVLGESEIS